MFDSLFNRKKPVVGAGHLDAMIADLKPEVNQDSVLNYLIEISEANYKKIVSVANLYRDANRKAAKILGSEEIVPVANTLPTVAEVSAPFIDEPPKQLPQQRKVVDVKDNSDKPLPTQGS